jgi:hypothetical protein
MAQASRTPKARLIQDTVSPGVEVKTFFRKPTATPGPPGLALFAAVGGMIVFGLWKTVQHNRQNKYVALEIRKHTSSSLIRQVIRLGLYHFRKTHFL